MRGQASRSFGLWLCAGLLASLAQTAVADATIDEKISFDLGFMKADSIAKEQYATGKKHRSAELQCSGFMSLFCPKGASGEIVRLDKNVMYELQPDKKTYREEAFPTEAQRREMRQRMEATMEKAKQCAAQRPQAQKPAVDTSKCDLSPPVFDVRNLGDGGQILGHGVNRVQTTMTQSCTNRETGDVCDLQYAFDVWLTPDKIDGFEERQAFEKAYLAKMGLTGAQGVAMQKSMQQLLAPYAAQMRQLATKSASLRGHPLRTTFRLAYGGARCVAASKSSAANGGSGEVGDQGGVPTSLGDLGSKLLGGFLKKKATESTETANAADPTLPPGMAAMVRVSTEVTGIATGPIPADQFEVPADWTLVVQPPSSAADTASCGPDGK